MRTNGSDIGVTWEFFSGSGPTVKYVYCLIPKIFFIIMKMYYNS